VLLSFAEQIIEIQAGANHSAFINRNNVLSMCGNGARGQLGLNESDLRSTASALVFNPMQVRDSVRKVACGEYHTLIIETDTDAVLVAGANDRF
jgi:alpha-tubulin suppressor-like RCC1 family protein